MAETRRGTLGDALDPARIETLVTELAAFPSKSQYEAHVEDALWRTITGGRATDQRQIDYADLPSESKSLFGFVEEDDERTLPWWFDEFDWTVTARGDDLTIGSVEDVETLSNYDPDALTLTKPIHRAGPGSVLDTFEDVREELNARLDLNEDRDRGGLPESVFEVKDRTLRTTSAFGEWFDDLVACCPPINETFTALFLVNTNVERGAIEGIVPKETLARLDQFVVNDGMVYNETIQTAGRKLLSLRGAYDRLLPVEIDVNPLPPLEALFYQTWVNSTTADSELSRWVRQAAETNPDPLEPGEQSQFGVAALNAPLRIEYDRPIFTTLDHKKDRASYYENSKSKLAEIKRILRTSDYLGDD